MTSTLARAAAAALLLSLAACGGKTSRRALEERVAKLEDENDVLKQQLEEARAQAEEAGVAAERAKAALQVRQPLPRFAPEDRGYTAPDSARIGGNDSDGDRDAAQSGTAEDAAAEAAETAREALGQ